MFLLHFVLMHRLMKDDFRTKKDNSVYKYYKVIIVSYILNKEYINVNCILTYMCMSKLTKIDLLK